MGYDFDLIYYGGKENVVADALSQKEEEAGSSRAFLIALTLPILEWLEVLECEWLADRKLQKIIEELKLNQQGILVILGTMISDIREDWCQLPNLKLKRRCYILPMTVLQVAIQECTEP